MSSSASRFTPICRAASTRRSITPAARRTPRHRGARRPPTGPLHLTTTCSPVVSTAMGLADRCGAGGSKSNGTNSSSTVAPSSDSTIAHVVGGHGRADDCNSTSSVVSTSGKRSVRVGAIWPNFTNMPPQSSRELRRADLRNWRVPEPRESALACVVQDLARPAEGASLRLIVGSVHYGRWPTHLGHVDAEVRHERNQVCDEERNEQGCRKPRHHLRPKSVLPQQRQGDGPSK